jgi:hypothetical protein
MVIKLLIAAILAGGIIYGTIHYVNQTETLNFETICLEDNKYFHEELCSHVGKRAYSIPSVAALNQKDFGPIIGVTWRKVGNLISGSGMKSRRSKQNTYYYIIGHDKNTNYQRLMLVNEVSTESVK